MGAAAQLGLPQWCGIIEKDSDMKTFVLIDLGRASAVTASNSFGATPEAGNPVLRQYIG